MISVNNNIQSAINSSLSSKTNELIETAKQTIQEAQQTTVQSSSQTTLSTRGERLAALNQDFDIVNPNFTITDDFLTRLAELNFISSGELASLQQEVSVNNTSDSEADSSLAGIKQKTIDIIERFKNDGQADSLVAILNKATDIIDNFGKASSPDISTTIAQLDYQLNKNEVATLTDQDKATLSELKTVLSIAEKLNPQSRTASNIDTYLQQFS
ncbi:hypothetical protein A9Q79_02285 [Methylophaga sp. 42_25_T18]|nr:hypothetical protein A9Q79_02285 [Methylophaga sp. 42_25_T18]OUR87171.1 hypothetical protein A9Q92_04730 [Methylophaga sp. 42_8_T64]